MSVRIEGERVIDAPRERVYEALTDPHAVVETIPLVERLETKGPDRWEILVKVPLPLAPKLRLSFEVVERRPPEHARLRSHGGGVGAGADVDSSFDLTDLDGRTRVRFVALISFRGALAPAERMLEPIAKRQSQKTLDAIERRASGGR